MSDEYCPNCERPTPRICFVTIALCTNLACIKSGHHVHNPSRSEVVCATCCMPFTITDHPQEAANG